MFERSVLDHIELTYQILISTEFSIKNVLLTRVFSVTNTNTIRTVILKF
jgi:hypothetical protein